MDRKGKYARVVPVHSLMGTREIPVVVWIMAILWMEGRSDMKKWSIICLLAVLGTVAACNREKKPQVSNAKTVTLKAGGAGTKTAISEVGGQFHLNWSAGDQLAVWETVPAIVDRIEQGNYDWGYESELYRSQPLASSAENAVFQLNLGERIAVENLGEIQYVAIYPASCAWDVSGGIWDYDADRVMIPVQLPTEQYPLANSFDPNADLLVSKPVVCNHSRPDELSFEFARVGTIAKIVVGSLPPGSRIIDGTFVPDFEAGYFFTYDPLKERIVASDGVAPIYFSYGDDGLPVGDDGKATIWLRTMSSVCKAFEFIITFRSDSGYHSRCRRVNLRPRGRTLEFKEGGLTTFSIDVAEPNVTNPAADKMDYRTNAAMDGVTVFWPVSTEEDFDGYECFLINESGVRRNFESRSTAGGIFEASIAGGLAPGTYTLFVRALAVEGKVSESDYEEMELKIGIPIKSMSLCYTLGYSNYSGDPDHHLELGHEGQDIEDLYWGILYHHRNLFWNSWKMKGVSSGNAWGLWSGSDNIRWSKMYLQQDSGDGTYSVYAADTFFTDGVPGTAVALPFTTNDDGEKVYDLGLHRHFLLCGDDDAAVYFNNFRFEYYK